MEKTKTEVEKKQSSFLIILILLLIAILIPFLLFFVAFALPFLCLGYITLKICEVPIQRNRDKLKTDYQLKQKTEYLQFLYKVEKTKNL